MGRSLGQIPTDASDTDQLLNLKGFAASLTQLDSGVKVEAAVATTSLDGQPAVVVSESDGSKVYVAATGQPLPLKITGTGEGDNGLGSIGNVTFDYGGTPEQLKAPTDAITLPEPSFDPSALASLLPSAFPSGFPSDFPSGLPSALASELQSLEHGSGGAMPGSPAPAPTP